MLRKQCNRAAARITAGYAAALVDGKHAVTVRLARPANAEGQIGHEEVNSGNVCRVNNRPVRVSSSSRQRVHEEGRNVRRSALSLQPQQLDVGQLLNQGKRQPVHGSDWDERDLFPIYIQQLRQPQQRPKKKHDTVLLQLPQLRRSVAHWGIANGSIDDRCHRLTAGFVRFALGTCN